MRCSPGEHNIKGDNDSMIGVTRLLCGAAQSGDALRYGRHGAASHGGASHGGTRDSLQRKPIVVWNSTKACNLACAHCYYGASERKAADEMSTVEAKHMIDNLAAFGAPVLLFSGGEPLMRADLLELGAYARERGLRTVISTNGTLISEKRARQIEKTGFSYVSISLDGIGATNDAFRGVPGAYEAALAGIRNCKRAGVRVGLRLTLHKHNVADLEPIFALLDREEIPRACFYHLVYSGRGRVIRDDDLTLDESRRAVELIFQQAEHLHARRPEVEILTVDNHTDAPYLLRRVQERQPERAEEVLRLLRWNGGNASGIAIADIDHRGGVHADQFWQHYTFGNVRERPFGEIWTDTRDPLMAGLKDRRPLLKGRCAACRYLDICNGNLRVRAEAVHGDVWAPDPACYLSDEEVLA